MCIRDSYSAYLLQGGLQLPDREYYLADSEHARQLRARYQTHIAAILKLAGFTDTDARAIRILELEHAVAETHRSLADNENIHNANNTWTQADFSVKAPGLDWAEYFRAAGINQQGSFMVWQPEAFKGESALVVSIPLNTWKDWLALDVYKRQIQGAIGQNRRSADGLMMSCLLYTSRCV